MKTTPPGSSDPSWKHSIYCASRDGKACTCGPFACEVDESCGARQWRRSVSDRGLRSTPAGECYLDCWEYPDCPCGLLALTRAEIAAP